MVELLRNKLAGKKTLLLGFGREGRSSYKLIRKILPSFPLTIADSDVSVKENALVANDHHIGIGPMTRTRIRRPFIERKSCKVKTSPAIFDIGASPVHI